MDENTSLKALPSFKDSSLLPSQSEWSRIKEMSQIAVASGLIPQKNVAQAIVVALKGWELGIPPMQAFAHLTVVNGKLAPSAELQLSLIYRKFPSVKIEYVESNEKACRIRATRPGEIPFEMVFTIEEAERAQLTHKENWRKYPAAMLRARCIAAVARAKFPDALMGMSHTAEELGAEVNEEGEIIDVQGGTSSVQPSFPFEAPRASLTAHAEADTYRVDFGHDCKGKTLQELGEEKIRGIVQYLDQKKLKLTSHERFRDEAAKYLAQRVASSPSEPEPPAENSEGDLFSNIPL